jgi:hypothetical protein
MNMRVAVSQLGLGGVMGMAGVLALGAASMLTAQTPSVAVDHAAGPGPGIVAGPEIATGFDGGEFHGFGARTPVTGAPYSALRTTTRVETLANGSTITHTNQVKEARDSSGRTYLASVPSAAEGGEAHSFVRVFDPVGRESISWSSNAKQATVVHLPEPGQYAGARGFAAGENGGRPQFRGNSDAVTTESLGSKTINGVVADGTRVTRVIAAGKIGNSEAITITHDTWVAQDLKLEVERVDTDPRYGTTTVEVTNLSRAEPSAALFQAPAGLALKEITRGAGRGGFGGFEPAP